MTQKTNCLKKKKKNSVVTYISFLSCDKRILGKEGRLTVKSCSCQVKKASRTWPQTLSNLQPLIDSSHLTSHPPSAARAAAGCRSGQRAKSGEDGLNVSSAICHRRSPPAIQTESVTESEGRFVGRIHYNGCDGWRAFWQQQELAVKSSDEIQTNGDADAGWTGLGTQLWTGRIWKITHCHLQISPKK